MRSDAIGIFWLALALPAVLGAAEVMDITTKDGATIRDAMVETVNPDGIDVGYVDGGGQYVLKAIPYQELPDDLLKHFKIDPAAAQAHQQQTGGAGDLQVDAMTREQVEKCQTILQEIQDKLKGNEPNAYIAPEDVAFVIFANRRAVRLHWVADTPSGSIAAVEAVISGQPLDAALIELNAMALSQQGSWTGFIYPAGVKTSYQDQTLPVFTDSSEKAYDLANAVVEMYLAYQADHAPVAPNTDAPAAAAAVAPDAPADGGDQVDNSGGLVVGNYGVPYGYFVGGIGYRVPDWWIHNHYPPLYGGGATGANFRDDRGAGEADQRYLLRRQGSAGADQEVCGSGNFRQVRPAENAPRMQQIRRMPRGGGGFRR